MARLLDLPAELILAIIDYLQVDTKEASLLFDRLGYDQVYSPEPPLSVSRLHSFLLANCRLNSLLQPLLYRDIFVRRNVQLKQLSRSLQNNPSLKEHIISATLPWHSSMHGTLNGISHFFWFNNLRTLTIYGFCDWDSLKFDDSLIGTSSVECLRLIACGAHEQPLTTLLSWPVALKTLYYGIDKREWRLNYLFQLKRTLWTRAAFMRALQRQKATLVELTLARSWDDEDYLRNGPHLDLSEFTSLKTLRICHTFLGVNSHTPYEAWEGLPHSLEVLEVSYDDTDRALFVWANYKYDRFVLHLINHKRTYRTHLHTVIIHSTEKVHDLETGEKRPIGLLTWPSLTREAESAGIELKMGLGYEDAPTTRKVTFPSP
ncbi:hypothetical protein NUH16_002184 [Penicillium rubens]|jgi:hypothetical protein|uniref:F-box domain-containing protein n=1 Tax=Penicillium rubens (strain ATCC 28089 / DSM 1075 / NRRL 1951 / Wisconsin 54-1255) TaxID=500485 RepID=B6H1Y0_PENRW|nr:uncharacterized protein N7525_003789 [Penicillium rubens]KAJ5045367.1 hypothetical protein NUH16_002184 [Penicillium rubens]KAJ5838601.1 hypothetical protein N7525_003789 [Penicillium rubens]CAP91431.1 hypothetical protein PCH_Pc13g03620 [Penicillium rubens Wisconsin 54-1255]